MASVRSPPVTGTKYLCKTQLVLRADLDRFSQVNNIDTLLLEATLIPTLITGQGNVPCWVS